MSSLNSYRPEIDGMRAIAVVAVVLYHAQLNWGGVTVFSGGFIGVDIFLVISGYLITRLILKDLNHGTFSYIDFYVRRARRILPILFLVIFTTLPFAWLLMLPQSLEEFSASVMAAMTMSSNFLFWQQDSYWAVKNEVNPLLHTWSLAIEEQFYIIFPPLLLAVWKYAKIRLLTVLLIIVFASFMANALTVSAYPEAAFYLLYSRIWELGLGAVLAVLERAQKRNLGYQKSGLFALIGLLAILVPMFFYNSETPQPSAYTLIPVLGACLLIWVSSEENFVSQLLSKRLLVKIGLLSYGWYLWHYPVFAFARIYQDNLGNVEMIALAVFSLLLAWVSYHLIEQPMRYSKAFTLKTFGTIIAGTFVGVMTFSTVTYLDRGNLGRYSERELALLGLTSKKETSYSYVVSEYDRLARGKLFSGSNDTKILLIGDSFSQDFYNILREAGFLKDVELIGYYLPGRCHNVPAHIDFMKRVKGKDKTRCKRVLHVGDDGLNERIKEADGIIVSSRWNNYTTKYLVELQDTLKKQGGRNILIVGRKNFPDPENFLKYLQSEDTGAHNSFSVSESHVRLMEQFVNLSGSLDHYLNLHALACGEGNKCPVATTSGYLISHDRDHLTREGAKYFAELLKGSPNFTRFWNAVNQRQNK